MSTQVLMPALSPTMSEGKLSKWLVKEGDVVKAGDLIAEIETDKAIMEFESSEDGTIIKLLIKEGEENIKVNEPIAVLDTSNLKSLSKDVDKNDRKNIDFESDIDIEVNSKIDSSFEYAETIEEEETLSLHDKEVEMIKQALIRTNGRRKNAAKELGISERTLYRKIKQHNLGDVSDL